STPSTLRSWACMIPASRNSTAGLYIRISARALTSTRDLLYSVNCRRAFRELTGCSSIYLTRHGQLSTFWQKKLVTLSDSLRPRKNDQLEPHANDYAAAAQVTCASWTPPTPSCTNYLPSYPQHRPQTPQIRMNRLNPHIYGSRAVSPARYQWHCQAGVAGQQK